MSQIKERLFVEVLPVCVSPRVALNILRAKRSSPSSTTVSRCSFPAKNHRRTPTRQFTKYTSYRHLSTAPSFLIKRVSKLQPLTRAQAFHELQMLHDKRARWVCLCNMCRAVPACYLRLRTTIVFLNLLFLLRVTVFPVPR